LAMGKGDGKWGKKGDGLVGPGGPGVGPGAAAWKGLAKWGGKGDKSEKGNWISQPEDGPELKRPRMDAMGPEFSLKGRDGGKGLGKGLAPGLAKGHMVPPGLMPTGQPDPKGGKGLAGPGGFVLPQAPLHTGLLPPGHTAPAMALNMAKSAAVGAGPPGKLVLLAPATKHITPVSSKTASTNNKKIAMEFVHASKDVQAQMLKDPTVARAILQTLAESPGTAPGMAVLGSGPLPPPPPASMMPPGQAMMSPLAQASAPAWTGVITLARNMAKKTPFRAALIQGKVADVEVVLRSAAANSSVADITHRVPFDEVAKKVASGSILSLVPNSIMEQASFDEYNKYFRAKSRAGVARLDGSLALYVMPCGEDILALKDSLYALGPHIPRAGCLIGLIAPGTAAVNAAPATAAPVGTATASKPPKQEPQEAQPPPKEAPVEDKAPPVVAKEEDKATGGGEGGDGMSSKELMDLFSNPDLIQLLQKEVGEES